MPQSRHKPCRGLAPGLANKVAFASAPAMPEIRAAGSARVPSVPRVPDIRAGSQVYESSPSEADMGSPPPSAPISQHMQQGYVAGHVPENRAAIKAAGSARGPSAPRAGSHMPDFEFEVRSFAHISFFFFSCAMSNNPIRPIPRRIEKK